jgi:hypothetical protein
MPVIQKIKKAIPNCSVAVNQGKSTWMSSVLTSVLLILLADCQQTSFVLNSWKMRETECCGSHLLPRRGDVKYKLKLTHFPVYSYTTLRNMTENKPYNFYSSPKLGSSLAYQIRILFQ